MRTPYTGIPAHRHTKFHFQFQKQIYSRLSCPVWRRAHSGRCLHRTNQLRVLPFLYTLDEPQQRVGKKQLKIDLNLWAIVYHFINVGLLFLVFFFLQSFRFFFVVPGRQPIYHLPNDIKYAETTKMRENHHIGFSFGFYFSRSESHSIRTDCGQIVKFTIPIFWNWWNGNWYYFIIVGFETLPKINMAIQQ